MVALEWQTSTLSENFTSLTSLESEIWHLKVTNQRAVFFKFECCRSVCLLRFTRSPITLSTGANTNLNRALYSTLVHWQEKRTIFKNTPERERERKNMRLDEENAVPGSSRIKRCLFGSSDPDLVHNQYSKMIRDHLKVIFLNFV